MICLTLFLKFQYEGDGDPQCGYVFDVSGHQKNIARLAVEGSLKYKACSPALDKRIRRIRAHGVPDSCAALVLSVV